MNQFIDRTNRMPVRKRPWTRREGKRFIFETGLIANFVSALLTLMAFVSPYWFISWPRVYNGFKMIGLWEVCFSGMILEMDPAQKSYHGCWWILAPEFYKIRQWLMPGWFIFTQVAVTICLVAQLIGFGMAFVIWLRTGMTQRNIDKKPRRDPLSMLHILAGITIGSGFLMLSSVMVFGINAELDKNWMPFPKLNYLSWSYGLAILSCFFSIFGSIAQVTHVMILRQELREPPKNITMTSSEDTSKWKDKESEYVSIHKSKESINDVFE